VHASGAPDLDAPCGLGTGSTTSRGTVEAAAFEGTVDISVVTCQQRSILIAST
jgi:hypothetical protein